MSSLININGSNLLLQQHNIFVYLVNPPTIVKIRETYCIVKYCQLTAYLHCLNSADPNSRIFCPAFFETWQILMTCGQPVLLQAS